MNCCGPTEPIGNFFSRFANLTSKKFMKKGLEKEQKQLMRCLERVGFKNHSILEIGCGVGSFHMTMLDSGASKAVGVDISDKMLDKARSLAKKMGKEDKTDYKLGDFVNIEENIQTADITILDKVVCCYPNPKELVKKSTSKTAKIYALTLPRKNHLTRIVFGSMAVLLWIVRSGFRPYVHDPEDVQDWIQEGGFSKVQEESNSFWMSQVYVRS